ncbi:putative protein transport protein SFT2-like [Capsicum annuum]|uniref:uncharacterized protein LOC107841895 n=1 Tax=Capsicum annuum TaxID=4072 RepID=UPI0007BEA7F8|nr:uncharacterized protein LOC107841895 [Capsicum annuum]KAF3634106.1 putative protein transport protein SFT2-like [Capsicum annuum]KAF3646365.1 putative protein transport protein SFT2-like [Capsicum annuum]
MDTQIPINSQSLMSPNIIIDEFEDLEVTQFDEDTLRELLFEEEEKTNYDNNNIVHDCVMQPMVIEMAPNYAKNEEGEEEEEEELVIEDFEWLEMMELSDTVACHEGGVNEIFDVGEIAFDFSHFCSSFPLEEIGYDALWQNSS